jgi:hypothetical protein
VKNRRVRRVLSDWTFLGAVVVTVALVVSVLLGRVALNLSVVAILLSFWVIVLVLQYERVLELLEETKAGRLELKTEIKKLGVSASDVEVAKRLPLISMGAFVERESKLDSGDSVLVFANTLEVDHEPMFEVVVANLKRGVNYRYILFETDQADDWVKFTRLLEKNGVRNIPEVLFEGSTIATLLKSSSVIYDFAGRGKAPEGFCVLATSSALDTCVLLSPDVARQTRDAFNRVWRTLKARSGAKPRDAQSKGH